MLLKEIILANTTKVGGGELRVGPTYLCLIRGGFHVGKFTEQWYGLSFNGWRFNPAGLQYDPPGTNFSSWQRVWLIEGAEELQPFTKNDGDNYCADFEETGD